MKHKKILVVVGAVALTAALAGGALALSGGDSLVSLSYLNNTFLPSAQTQLEQTATQPLQEAYDEAVAKLQGEDGQSGLYSDSLNSRTFTQGDVIGLLNAGDRYLPGALRLVAESFRKEGMDGRIFWGDVEYSRLGRVRGFRPENLRRGAFAPHPSMFVPKRVYESVGLYDETFRLLGDFDFMYRAVNVCGIRPLYVPEIVAFYQEGGLSDRHIAACLRDELRVKLRYGAPKWQAYGLFLLKILKNLPRMVLA